MDKYKGDKPVRVLGPTGEKVSHKPTLKEWVLNILYEKLASLKGEISRLLVLQGSGMYHDQMDEIGKTVKAYEMQEKALIQVIKMVDSHFKE